MQRLEKGRRLLGVGMLVGMITMAGCMLFQPNVGVDFETSRTEGVTPMVVEFSPVVAGEIAACYWDFGDGATSTEMAPVHVYRAAGTYDVFLRVTLSDGSGGTVKKEELIDVALITRKAELTDLYWLNANNGTLHRGDRYGNNEQTIISYVYRGGDLAVGGGYVYWVADDSIYRANDDGSGKKAIVNNQTGLRSVSVDGGVGQLYWACQPSGPFSNDYWKGSLKQADLNGENRATLESYKSSSDHFTWWIRADAGGSGLFRYYDDDNLVVPAEITPHAMDDGKLQLLVHVSATSVAHANLRDSMNGVTALATDVGADLAYYLYWVSRSSIKRSRVDGSGVTTILRGLDSPRGVAADVVEGKMYWSDRHGIHRANLDGTGAETIYPGVRADALVIQER